MNQQQLQNARKALWRQNGQPLLTRDDAAVWLDEMGICLFLPRHAQLPAPAPSIVEACAGEARATPTPAAIDAAMALVAWLVAEGRAVPLNLMGNLTEQPDYLVSPEALRWVSAVRGDRNWKSAPGGRIAPLVQRVWSTLDRAPGRTAVEVREELGRELTEAAVMRALVELWTTLRAAPEYAAGEPTRWSLMRDRYPRDLAAGANLAQTTALSALISLYLRQAVAATEEEAEIFLSPLTARSRIREVLHGMLATRQFGTMPLGVQTLLYLEGTLPEIAEQEPAPQIEMAAETAAPPVAGNEKLERALAHQPWSKSRPAPPREARTGFRRESPRPLERRPERSGRVKRGEPRDFGRGSMRPFQSGQRSDWKKGSKPFHRPEERREFRKPGGKPWQKQAEFRGRTAQRANQGGELGERHGQDRDFRRERKPGGWQAPRRPARDDRRREESRPERREFQLEKPRESRPENREPRENRREFRRAGAGKPQFRGKPGRPGSRQPGGFGERRGEFGKPGGKFGKPGPGSGKSGVKFGKPAPRFGKPGAKFGKPGGRFQKPSAGDGAPRAWRENKATRPGARSGKNRKGQKDEPE